MGFFDRKRDEKETDTMGPARPAAKVVTSAIKQPITPTPTPTPAPAMPTPAPVSRPSSVSTAPPRTTPLPDSGKYGIQQALELMRSLPKDNTDLVVQVVKKTLASMSVDVQAIIDDAKIKQARVETRISTLEEEIGALNEEVAARRQEIEALTADYVETRMVREQLELGSASGPSGYPPIKPPGSSVA